MKWYFVVIIVSICLLFFIAEPALAQMSKGGGQQTGDHGAASRMMQQGKSMRAGQGMHGLGFMHSAGNAYGEYVTFSIDAQTGAVLDYGVDGIMLFNISIANFNYRSTVESGSVTKVINNDNSTILQLHDNPAAVINILTAKSISVTFSLADGVTATVEDELVKIESGSVVGYIAGSGTITSTVSGSQVKVDASPNSGVVFRAAPVNMPMFDNLYRRYSQEIAGNRLGLEVAFGRNGTYNAINYSAGLHLGVQEMLNDRIRLRINATDQAGRIIAINLDNTSLQIGERDRLRIHYDGMPLECVNDPNMVLNDTDRPICWISPIQEKVRAQLMIHVPGYSEHQIDIVVEPESTAVPEASPTVTAALPADTERTPGFNLMTAMIALLTLALLTRRRNK